MNDAPGTYNQGAYTSFVHLTSPLVCNVNLFNIDNEFVQLCSVLFVSIIVYSVRHVRGSCLLSNSDLESTPL